jgi:hypothetical protein
MMKLTIGKRVLLLVGSPKKLEDCKLKSTPKGNLAIYLDT